MGSGGQREDWFPTPVWVFDHPDPGGLNAELLQLLMAEKAADPTGLGGRSSPLGWHSRDDLHRRPEWGPFIRFVEGAVAEAVAFLRWDPARVSPIVANCWGVINGKLAGNVVHTHPMCFLSGVYYVRADGGAGDLFFLDPRAAAAFVNVPVTEHTPWTFQRVSYKPVPGRLILFPAWLQHGVDPNLSDAERVVVSFNIGVKWHGGQ